MCVVPWSPFRETETRVFPFLVLCGGGVVCVNCIVDACDFFFVHVLVFLIFLATVCVFVFRHMVDAWAWQADEGRGGLR